MSMNLLKTGDIFNYLTVEQLVDTIDIGHKHVTHKYLCKCVCGKEIKVFQGELVSGHIKSCGCKGFSKVQPLKYDLSGMKFGMLQVIDQAETYWSDSGKSRMIRWNCVCDCNNKVTVNSRALRTGATCSCGCYQKKRVSETLTDDLIGQRFGMLRVLDRAGSHRRKNSNCGVTAMWRCKCDCGKEIVTYGWSLKCGDAVSCGCLKISIAEQYVRELLSEYGFIEDETYFREKTFPDLKSNYGGQLRFDFVVNVQSKIVLIECQGRQHYESIKWFGGDEAFARRSENDDIKRVWAKEHNYQLVEIPYTVTTKDKFRDILIKEQIIELTN